MLRRTGLVGLLLALAFLLSPGVPAGAAGASGALCTREVVGDDGVTGEVRYVSCDDGREGGSGEGSQDGGSGSGEPACDLSGSGEYCIGTSACWSNLPSALDPATWPEETRPSPEAIYTYQSCRPDVDGTLTGWSWYEPEEVSTAEAARQAFGLLATPTFTVGVNPPAIAVVGVDTWFWAQSPQTGMITGSSALGVVAIGDPHRLEVDPGDGSDVISCPWSTSESDECSYTYARSSAGKALGPSGYASYTARMRLVYDVRFEDNGVPLVVAGLPATLESPWQAVSVPVAEIQSIVTSSS